MNEITKRKISVLLLEKKKELDLSDRQLGIRIGDIGATSINHIITLRWEKNPQLVSDSVFQKVATFLNMNEDWIINRKAQNFMLVQFLAEEAKVKSESFAIAAPPGQCKSEAAKDYANNPNVYYITCEAHFTKCVFLLTIMKAMGMTGSSLQVAEMVDRIVDRLNSQTKPLLIIDEADKLHDSIFQFFITFYNRTINNCGFLFLGSVFFENRVKKGARLNHQGYTEFHSRIGNFINLKPLDKDSITTICKLNGLTDQIQINTVINSSNNDLRFVKRKTEEFRKLNMISELRLQKLNGMGVKEKEEVA